MPHTTTTEPAIKDFYTGYQDAHALQRDADALAARFPSLCTTIQLPYKTFGYSGKGVTASDGKPVVKGPYQVKAYRLGSGTAGKTGCLIHGSPHAREWVPKMVILEFMGRLLQNYGTDAYLTDIMNNVDIFLIPDQNPDGAMYSFYDSAMQRKNLHVNNALGPLGEWRCLPPVSDNACQIDNNRNYSVQFGDLGGSGLCIAENYKGGCGNNEPETRNIVWLLQNHGNIRFHCDMHSFGNYLLWPPGVNTAVLNSSLDPLDSALTPSAQPDELSGGSSQQYAGFLNNNAQRLRGAVHVHRGTTISQSTVGPIYKVLYDAAGSSADESYYNHSGANAAIRRNASDQHQNKIWPLDFEVGDDAHGFQPAWSEAHEQIMEFALAATELAACARDYEKGTWHP
jgi:hypothetical protein